MQNVLISTPGWEKLNEYTLRCIFEMDNQTGGKLDVFIPNKGHINLDDGGRENLVSKQEMSRSLALSGGYDWLLFVEEDMVVPPNALELLLACDSSVAYGLYVFRRPPYLWNAFVVMDPDKMVGHPLTSNPALAIDKFASGSIIDTDGVGFGCTLIHRSVLEKIAFRINYDTPHQNGEYSHSDFYFAMDCLNAGIKSKIHLGCVCGHISPLDEIGRKIPSIIYPTLDGIDGTYYKFVKL